LQFDTNLNVNGKLRKPVSEEVNEEMTVTGTTFDLLHKLHFPESWLLANAAEFLPA
jgi:hypothetical protein